MARRLLARALLRAASARVARSLVRRAHANLLASRSFAETLEPRQLLARATGIDVSHYSGTINWSSVAGAGYAFAYAKATEGASVVDVDMTANLAGGASAGVLMGAYHHAKPDAAANDAVNEANWFVQKAGNFIKPGYLRPALDVSEGATGTTGGTLSKAQLSAWVNAFCSTVKSATGVDPVVYTNNDYATTYLDGSVGANHDLWIARWSTAYGTPTTTGSPPVGAWGTAGETWDVWQYSNTGTVAGVPGGADLDVFNGDRAALDAFVIGAMATPSFALGLDFGPTGATVPSGYVNVPNTLFGTQGNQQMGWLQSGVTTDSRSAGTAPDVRYRTFAMPALGGVSRSFEVAVPNGSYAVHVVTGSPDQYPNAQKITVEGVTAVNASTSSTQPFLAGTVTVNVTDGRLTLGSDYNGAANTRLDYVDITSNTPAATGYQAGFKFGPDGTKAIAGYRTDLGNAYALRSNGYWFGWSDATTGTPSDNPATFLGGGEDDKRLNNGIGTNGKTWEMKVPNGTYWVKLVAGDAGVTSGTYGYAVEGNATFLAGTAGTGAARWITATGAVTVTDGKLTIRNAPGATNHALAYVEITDYTAMGRSTVTAPADVVATAAGDNVVDVRWTDHSDNETSFKVERASDPAGPWTTLTTSVYANAGRYEDNGSTGATYYYRVSALKNGPSSAASTATLSNVLVTPDSDVHGRKLYNPTRTHWTTEQTIQAEDYDAGGQNVAYHDSADGNAGGYYRSGSGDIGFNVFDPKYFLGWTKAGEWNEFTIDVPTSGTYQLQASVASGGVGGTFGISIDNAAKGGTVQVPDATDFTLYQQVTSAPFTLTAGAGRVLRLSALGNDPSGFWVGDFDWLKLVRVGDATGSISGLVFDDRNGNGARDDGTVPGVPPTVVFVVDESLFSTDRYFDGTENGNVNRDPLPSQTLDAEIAGALSMNQQLIDDGFGSTADVSLVSYSGVGESVDLDPVTPGVQLVTHPLTDADADGVPDFEAAIRQQVTHDYANFDSGLARTIQVVDALHVAPGAGTVVFLSAGQNTDGDSIATSAATLHDPARGLTVRAFGFGADAYMTNLQVLDPGAARVASTDQVTVAFPRIAPSATPEEGLAGWQVFADLNANGALDVNEPTATTDVDGAYTIGALAAGTYPVRIVPQSAWTRTTPTAGGYTTSLAAGQDVTGDDFGQHSAGSTTIAHGGTNSNHHPLPVPYAPQAAPEAFVGTPWSWNAGAAFADADGDALHFALDYKHYLTYVPANGLAIDPNTGVFSWTPQPSDFIGSIRFVDYVVTDGHGPGSAYYGTFQLMVLPARSGPLVSIASSAVPIHEHDGDAATFTVTLQQVGGVTDPITVNLTTPDHYDGDAGSDDYTVSGLNGTAFPSSITFTPPAGGFGGGPQTRTFTVRAVNDGSTEGDEILAVYASAGDGYTVGSPTYADVTIVDDGTSTPTNHPPHAVPTAPQPPTTATVGQTYTWDFSQDFADEDGDTLQYSLITPIENLSLNSNTGLLTWTPSQDEVGTQTVAITISDSHMSALTSSVFVNVGIESNDDLDPLAIYNAYFDDSTGTPGILLSWYVLAGSDKYDIWRSDNAEMNDAVQIAEDVAATTYFDSTIVAGNSNDYYYAIVGAASTLSTPSSISAMAATAGKTAGPSTGVHAHGVGAAASLYAERIDENNIQLTWKDGSSVNSLLYSQNFIVQMRGRFDWQDIGGVDPLLGDQTHALITDLDPGTIYEFRVVEKTKSRVTNAGVSSDTSAGVVVETPQLGDFKGLVITVLGHFQYLNSLPADVYNSVSYEPAFQHDGDNNRIPGVTELALDLRREGYRVLRLSEYEPDHPALDAFGNGWPVDWILDKVLSVGIRQIAIVGYSHGASEALQLANRLNAQRDPIHDLWNITYLATTDGIVRHDTYDGIPAPALTYSTDFDLHHDNFYSLRGWYYMNNINPLNGALISDADSNYPKDTNHSNIDNNAYVQAGIRQGVELYTPAAD